MNPSAGLHRVSSALALLALLVAAHLGAAAGDMPGPRVLVVHSYAPDFSWTRDLHAGIVSVLQGPEVQGRYRVEYMDAKRHHSPEYIRQLLGIYRQKYAGERFDGIILTDDHALDLMARHWAELFRARPWWPAASTT